MLSIHYANREKDKFSDIVFNETVELVPQPPAEGYPAMILAASGGLLLLLLIAGVMAVGRGTPAEAAAAKKPKVRRHASLCDCGSL